MKKIFLLTFNKAKSAWNSFANSKVGKVLLGNVVSYGISLVSAGIMLSGLFSPISPIIIAFAAVTLVGVVVHSVTETLKIRKIRKLHQESNLLRQYRKAKDQQNYILNALPNLDKVLDLNNTTDENLKKKQYNLHSKITLLKNIATVSAQTIAPAFYLTEAVIGAMSGNMVSILKSTTYGITTTTSLINNTLTEQELNSLKNNFKSLINEERNQPDTLYYQNLKELKKDTLDQIIQTLALKEVLHDPEFLNLHDYDKKQYFNEVKEKYQNIDQFIGPLTERDSKFAKTKIKNSKEGNIFKDFVVSLDPFHIKPEVKNSKKARNDLELLLELKTPEEKKYLEQIVSHFSTTESSSVQAKTKFQDRVSQKNLSHNLSKYR